MTTTKAHCNACGGDRNHEVLHSERTRWDDEASGISGSDTYSTLRCAGCENIKLRHISWFSEDDEPKERYFPPAIFRQAPAWFGLLQYELEDADQFVPRLLREIYTALQNDLPSLAAMGVRGLLEQVMITKVGDLGSFGANISAFEKIGYVSTKQRERLETILDAGHATIHRAFEPKIADIVTLVDISEHIIETVYLHESKVTQLKARVPQRPARVKKAKSATEA